MFVPSVMRRTLKNGMKNSGRAGFTVLWTNPANGDSLTVRSRDLQAYASWSRKSVEEVKHILLRQHLPQMLEAS